MAEVFLYDPISKVSTNEVRLGISALKDTEETLTVRFNTPGGSYFEGAAIYGLLSSLPNPTVSMIDGLAASAGAFAAMGSDKVLISDMGKIMIHSATVGMGGSEDKQRKMLALTEKLNETQSIVFGRKMKMRPSRVRTLLNNETWFTAKEAIAQGLANGNYSELPIAALYKLNNNMKIPTTIDEIKAWMKISKGEKLEASEQGLIQNEAFDVAAELLNEVEAEIKADAEAADGLDKLDATLVKKEDYLTKVKLFEASLDGLIAIAEKFPTEEKIEELANAKFEEKFNAFLAKLRSNQQVPTAENGFQTLKAEEGQKKQTFSTMDAQKASQEHFNNK